jgi:hypothetical protein
MYHWAAFGVFKGRKPFSALPDLPASSPEVLFVSVLWPVLARGLLSWATGATYGLVVSRVSWLTLIAQFVPGFVYF